MSEPLHLHFENHAALGPVFQATPERVEAALAKRPELRERLRITIGLDGEGYAEAMQTADILFGWNFDRALIAGGGAPRLRWVHAHGAGINHLLPLDWLPKRAVLTNSRGVHAEKADEYTIMALLMLNNRLPESATHQRAARWEQVFSSSIVGKTVLVIGVGHIGAGAARWAKRFGLNVIGIRRSGRRHAHVHEMHTPDALHALLPRADFVLVSAPHTDETTHLIGAAELALMKDGAGLVNYSRAHLVDYDALRAELEKGRLSAILDVFDPEPLPASSPLWRTPNLIMTPHCASDDTERFTPKTLDLVFGNVTRLLAGKPLVNRVNRVRQY
ncbi:D-2-hydroxyacid dehydrogenase [Starkeya koreensis]|uniref:D-2-hydroxyacid dehydrogenase n=1 Tax=Ancylobacter koreensis TaxID=266121 RepID=A0ABT0DKL6_9HYPH|nr:D-2-hydroxyacid dehydrogenase [Ancylobacter koreensis]MCK0207709.1 D-2-hydroxyacid dehydrogenase [Ancylobacter koreensis]